MSEPAQAAEEHAPPLNQPSLSDWADIVPEQAADQHQAAHKHDQTAAGPAAAAASAPAQPPAAASAAADDAAAVAPPPSGGRLVQVGDTVILEVNRDRYSFVHVKRGGCDAVNIAAGNSALCLAVYHST